MSDVSDAIANATAAAVKEFEATNEPAAAPAPAAPAPAKEPETKTEAKTETKAEAKTEPAPAKKDEAAAPASEENPLDLTSEDLQAIEGDPLLRKAYKTVLRGFTAKTTKLASERKQFEEDLATINWFRSDPDNALRVMARMRGIDLGAPKTPATEAVDEVNEIMLKTFGPEGAATLKPVFETIVQKLFDKRIAPHQAEIEALRDRAVENGIDSTVNNFISELHENDEEYNDEIQTQMAQLANRVKKADDVPLKDHLRTLYNSVMHERTKRGEVTASLKRLQDARKKSEPVVGVRPEPAAERKITSDMSLNDKVALAVQLAREGK